MAPQCLQAPLTDRVNCFLSCIWVWAPITITSLASVAVLITSSVPCWAKFKAGQAWFWCRCPLKWPIKVRELDGRPATGFHICCAIILGLVCPRGIILYLGVVPLFPAVWWAISVFLWLLHRLLYATISSLNFKRLYRLFCQLSCIYWQRLLALLLLYVKHVCQMA